jgi:hypothetical protein
MEMGRRLAITIAVLYWLAVTVSYIVAAIADDGLAFVQLFLLSMPWCVVMATAYQIANHAPAATTLASWCWLLSGISAFVLYFLIDRFFLVLRKPTGEAKR